MFGINLSVIVISAVRYMLGRSSYGVGSVCDFLIDNKDKLSESNKKVITRDVEEYIEENPNISYRKDWEDMLKIINK